MITIDVNAFLNVLPMVFYGMAGIFIVTAVIYASVVILNKVFSPEENK